MAQNVLAQATEIGGNLTGPGGYYKNPSDISQATDSFSTFASNVLGFFTVLASIMFLLYFILGAINWITAGGDSGKVDKAKSQMSNAAIGLIIVVLAYSIAAIVGKVLGIQILNPGSIINNLGPWSDVRCEGYDC